MTEQEEREELIARLQKKQVRLSQSSLKKFTSPVDFVNGKLKGFKQNAGMRFGSIGDCLFLTPEDFDNQFVVGVSAPSTDLQVSYAELALKELKEWGIKNVDDVNDKQLELLFNKSDYKGDAARKAESTFNSLSSYIQNTLDKKTSISQKELDEAHEVINNLLQFEDVARLHSNIIDAQVELDFKYMGWKHKSYLDFTLPNAIWDLKYSDDCTFDKFSRSISNFQYDFQAGYYTKGAEITKLFGDETTPRYNFLVYDKKGNYNVIPMDHGYVRYGQRQFQHHMEHLNRCVEENAWDQSYNFFKRTQTAYKPKWAKGYVLSTDGPMDN